MSNWLFPWIILLQYKNIFKILARMFLLFMLRKKKDNVPHNLSSDKQSAQSTNEKYDEKYDEKLTSTKDHVSYDRNISGCCYKPLTESNGCISCLWG